MIGARDRRVALGDGVATTVVEWGERGPVVLCVHGITSSRRSWTRFGERFADRFRVYAFDQRGHGDSAAVTGPMTLERSAADLAAVAAALPGPLHAIVGHSWGGAVALLGGLELRPERVVAVDPMLSVAPGTFETEYVDDVRNVLALEPAPREAALRAMYAALQSSDVAAKLHAMMPMRIEPLERLGRDNRVDAGGWDLRERVVDYPVALLACVAGEDSVLSAADLALLRERGGESVTVRVYEGEGHNLHRTAFDAFASDVASFL